MSTEFDNRDKTDSQPDTKTDRQERLDQALRDNLKKRKAQARARKKPQSDPENGAQKP